MKILVKNPFTYDEEIGHIEVGIYDYEDCPSYHYPRIKYNGEWLDLAGIDTIKDDIQILDYWQTHNDMI